MSSASALEHGGVFVHEAAVYGSDEELIELLVPHLRAGAAAGEPSIVSITDRERALVQGALDGAANAVTFLPALTPYDRPAALVARLTTAFRQLVEDGAAHVRFVNTVPHPGVGAPWDGWCRYEAAANDLFSNLPLWATCLYDGRAAPPDVLRDVERTHRRVAASAGPPKTSGYEDPRSFLLSLAPGPDELEAEPPAARLVEPTTAAARRVVEDLARRSDLNREQVEDLVIAASEVVANAILHGLPPVTLTVWTGPERVVLNVHDHGQGPADPYVGLVPRRASDGGNDALGLWIVDQLGPVTYLRDRGFTVRLIGGRPLPDPH